MTPSDFRARLKALGLTIRGFCGMTGVNPTTAGYWGRDRPGAGAQEFPKWVPLLLAAWEAAPRKTVQLLTRSPKASPVK